MQLLDHGYCHLIETWGSDERIIEAARMSTAKGFLGWELACPLCGGDRARACGCTRCQGRGIIEGDSRLLSYLWTHEHHTPFEMAGLVIEVQAPIFVTREWMRHRTFSYNEMSGRYIELPNLYYIPAVERLMAGKQGQKNKQGSEEGFTEKEAFDLRQELIYATTQARLAYERLLAMGLSKELSRVVVPVSQYTRFRVAGNLRNWLHFLDLRMAEDAQYEIRMYANAVAELIAEQFPRTYALLEEGQQQ